MNRLLQRFVADPSAPAPDHQPAPAGGHDARDNPQLESLMAPPPHAAVAAGPPRSSGARLYPLPPRSASRGYPQAAARSNSVASAPPRSLNGRFPPYAPPPAAPAPVTPDHPAFFYYQHNPYQYQVQEFQRQQPHPPPPPSSSGSQRRGSGNALDPTINGYEEIPLSTARSTYETVDLNDDAKPLPGRVAPPRSADGKAAGAFFGAFQAPPPRSTGSSTSASSDAAFHRPVNGGATTAAFFQQQPQQQQQQQHQQPKQQQQQEQQQAVPSDDARSVSDLFGSSASSMDQPPPQTPPLAPQAPSLHRNLSTSDLFASPAPANGVSAPPSPSPSPFDSRPLEANDGFAISTNNLSTPPPVVAPAPASTNGTAAPRALGIARSPVQKPTHRRVSSGSFTSALGIPPPLSARQLAMHDRLRNHHAAGAKAKAMSVDLDYDHQRARALGRSQVTTLDDSIKLADMYKQMAERLQGEKQDLLKVIATQADQIAALQRRVATLEQQKAGGDARDS